MKSKYDYTDYRSTIGHKGGTGIDKEKVVKGVGVAAGLAISVVAVAAKGVNEIAAHMLNGLFNKK